MQAPTFRDELHAIRIRRSGRRLSGKRISIALHSNRMRMLDRHLLGMKCVLMLLARGCTELTLIAGSIAALIITMMWSWTPISPVCQYRTHFQLHVARLNTCHFNHAIHTMWWREMLGLHVLGGRDFGVGVELSDDDNAPPAQSGDDVRAGGGE